MHPVARHLVVHGAVQGVGYRAAVVEAARAFGVAGWVRNRRDGTVEAFVQGAPDPVTALVRWCHEGPPMARVTHVDVTEASPVTHTGFDWRPTE